MNCGSDKMREATNRKVRVKFSNNFKEIIFNFIPMIVVIIIIFGLNSILFEIIYDNFGLFYLLMLFIISIVAIIISIIITLLKIIKDINKSK